MDVYADALCRALRDPYRPQGSAPHEPGSFFGRPATTAVPPRSQTPAEMMAVLTAAAKARTRKAQE